ncbi:MAG: NACHT domain-containing protein, partial [Bacteroidetes bacterium]|nr:NACHT domain-containing protein [Bacteroidota bacterium]
MPISTILTNYHNYKNNLIRDFEASRIRAYYEDLIISNIKDTPIEQSSAFFNRWINDKTASPCILLLGDYGTGKTSLCHKLSFDYAIQCNKGCGQRIPILVHFNNCKGEIECIESLILNTVNPATSIPDKDFDLLKSANKNGQLFLLFDGFDDLTLKNDQKLIHNNLNQILKTIHFNSKVLITCRTEYFKSIEDIKKIFEAYTYADGGSQTTPEIYYINYLQPTQIYNIIENRVYRKAKLYYKRIHDTQTLAEIARRPLFLDKIIDTLQFIIENNIQNPKIAYIFQIYINSYLKDLEEKKRSELPAIYASKLLAKIAIKMHLQKTNLITFNEIESILKNSQTEAKECNVTASLNRQLDSIVARTFLLGSETKGYRFNHASIQYFFRAVCLHEAIVNNSKQLFETDFIGAETILFMADMLTLDEKDTLLEWLTDENVDIQKYSVILLGFIDGYSESISKSKLSSMERKEIVSKISEK